MEELKALQKQIDELENKNILLYNTFQYSMWKEEMQPLLEEWRKNSIVLKEMIKQKNNMLDTLPHLCKNTINKKPDIFVNGYGEATKREITTTTYRNQQKRLGKQVLNFIN